MAASWESLPLELQQLATSYMATDAKFTIAATSKENLKNLWTTGVMQKNRTVFMTNLLSMVVTMNRIKVCCSCQPYLSAHLSALLISRLRMPTA